MEEIKSPISNYLPFVKIHMDEIEGIISILEEANPVDIELKAENKKFNIKEFPELKKNKLKNLEINAVYSDYSNFSVSFDGYRLGGVYLRCFDSSIQNEGIAKKIKDLLIPRKQFFSNFILDFRLFMFSSITFGAIGGFFITDLIKNELSLKQFTLLMSILFLSLTVYLMNMPPLLGIIGKNVILLNYKKDCPGFFERNRDQITIGTFLAIFSFILGALFTKYLT